MSAVMQSGTPAANQPVFNERGLMDAAIPPEAETQRAMIIFDALEFILPTGT